MKRIRLLALLLAPALGLGGFALAADGGAEPPALDGAVEYDVWVNGERFTGDKLSIACGDGTAVLDPNATPYALTLTDAVATAGYEDPSGSVDALYAAVPLTVTLVGENTLGTERLPCGLWSDADLSIGGTGSLTAAAGRVGMGSFGDITITDTATVAASGAVHGLLCTGVLTCPENKAQALLTGDNKPRVVAASLLSNGVDAADFPGANTYFRVPVLYTVSVNLCVKNVGDASYSLAASAPVTDTLAALQTAVPALELDEMTFAGVAFFDRGGGTAQTAPEYQLGSDRGIAYIGLLKNGLEYGVETGQNNEGLSVLPADWVDALENSEWGTGQINYYFSQLIHVSVDYGFDAGKTDVSDLNNIPSTQSAEGFTLYQSLSGAPQTFTGWTLNGQPLPLAADTPYTVRSLAAAYPTAGVLETGDDGVRRLWYRFRSGWKTYSVSYYDEDYASAADRGTQLGRTSAALYSGDAIPACGVTPQKAAAAGSVFTFGGWTLAEGSEGAGSTVGATDLVYKASYTATPAGYYSVVYTDGRTNGATYAYRSSVGTDTRYAPLPDNAVTGFTRAGFHFSGWTLRSGSTVNGTGTELYGEPDGVICYDAQWTRDTGALSVTLRLTGASDLPAGFKLVLTGPDGVRRELTRADADTSAAGVFRWQASGLPTGSYRLAQEGLDSAVVTGLLSAYTVNRDQTTEASFTDAYAPAPTASPKSTPPIPTTGDRASPLLWLALVVAAAGALVAVLLLRKKRK